MPMMAAIRKFMRTGSSCASGAALTTTKLTSINIRLTTIATLTCFLFTFIAISPFDLTDYNLLTRSENALDFSPGTVRRVIFTPLSIR